MKLSFIPDGSPDCPLLMLSALSMREVANLRAIVGDLGTGKLNCATLDAGADSEMSLIIRAAGRDEGVLRTPSGFECHLTRLSWSNIEGLIEPFLKLPSGYQWLDQSGEISLLLSPGGTW